MYKCCVFDLDGTVADTIESIAYTANKTLDVYHLAPIVTDVYYKIIGDGYKKLIERALIYAGDKKLIYYEDALVTYLDFFQEYSTYNIKPYAGILSSLDYLRANNIKLAILSNKPHRETQRVVRYLFDDNAFDIIVGNQENVPKKPDKAGLMNILNEFKLEPKDCLYFGDTNTDMQTGKNAGVDTVGVTWGFRDRAELEAFAPKYMIDRPIQIIQLIDEMLEG